MIASGRKLTVAPSGASQLACCLDNTMLHHADSDTTDASTHTGGRFGGPKLVSTKFTISGGFAAVGEPNVAVCLLPGTEVAFEKEVEFECISGRYPNWKAETKLGEKVARFRQLHKNEPHKHHDALEFPDGQIVLVTRLCEGQEATVLQLPAAPRTANEVEEQKRVIVVA